MAFNKPMAPMSQSPMKAFWSKIKAVIMYPYKISKMITGYNAGVGEIIVETHDGSLDDYRTVNNKFLYSLIYLPIFLGFLSSATVVYMNQKTYERYINVLTTPAKSLSSTESFSRKVKFAVKEFPVKNTEWVPFVIGFFISLVGARFLSYHPAFAEIAKIQEALIGMRKIDKDGNPWRVVWTEEAILFLSYGYDPMKFVQEKDFWATINFSPGPPKISKTNMNKFVVQRKYELSGSMKFEIGEAEIKRIDDHLRKMKG